MVTRTFMALVLAFWLVMTVLLVRYTYFPDGSHFAQVPPRVVMKLFLEQGSQNNAMQVYHYDKKIGHASIDTRPIKGIDSKPGDPVRHVMKINGVLERGTLNFTREAVVCRLDARLKGMEEFEYFKGTITLQDTGMTLDFAWEAGERTPKIIVTQRGKPVEEFQVLQAIVTQVLGGGGPPPGAGGLPTEESVHMSTRESFMNIGGHKRRGYAMEIGASERWRLKAFFTEAGELALVNLPEGYRLMEQTIYGLTPDYGKEEEE